MTRVFENVRHDRADQWFVVDEHNFSHNLPVRIQAVSGHHETH